MKADDIFFFLLSLDIVSRLKSLAFPISQYQHFTIKISLPFFDVSELN